MKSASTELQAYLAQGAPGATVADCYTITCNNGLATQFYYTGYSIDLSYQGTTWTSNGVQIDRTSLNYKNTVEVPEYQLTLNVQPTVMLNGYPLLTAIHSGIFDGGTVLLERFYMPSPGDTSLGPVILFNGRISELTITATGVDMTIKGNNVLFNQNTPHNLYQANCIHSFCDTGCTLLEANFTIPGITGVGTNTTTYLVWAGAPGDTTGYIFGKIAFTSGILEGYSATIGNVVVNSGITTILPTYPFPYSPNPGDSFNITQGCNKTQTRCSGLSNLQHFRAFPYIPPVETGL